MLRGLKSSMALPSMRLAYLYMNTSLAVVCTSGIRSLLSQKFKVLAILVARLNVIAMRRSVGLRSACYYLN